LGALASVDAALSLGVVSVDENAHQRYETSKEELRGLITMGPKHVDSLHVSVISGL